LKTKEKNKHKAHQMLQNKTNPSTKEMFANKLEEEIYNLYHLGNLQETLGQLWKQQQLLTTAFKQASKMAS
jgi:tRNA A37 N6-isopentenylltransferase MiaA